MNKFNYIALLFALAVPDLLCQETKNERFVQVSGIITDIADRPVPGVSIMSKKLRKGTISENTGIYSITSTPGDTIFFRALGYKRYHTFIPENYPEKNANVDIMLESDTIEIDAVTILPWRNYHEFIMDMTREKEPDPILENMNENLASIYVSIANQRGAKISPEAGFKYAMEQNFNAMATRNQYPVNNLLNPFAWAKFIDGMKKGMFRNQKFSKPVKNSKIRKKKN